ncbi:MAG: hypothetical protein ACK56I_01805 [bacterium]
MAFTAQLFAEVFGRDGHAVEIHNLYGPVLEGGLYVHECGRGSV